MGSRRTAEAFAPESGDVFFQELGEHLLGGVAPPATLLGRDHRVVEHAALFACSDDGSPGLVEAFPPRVRWTPLATFLGRHLDPQGQPAVFVGRVRPQFRPLAAGAVAYARLRIGWPFDEWYDDREDAYYCSELIVASYRHANGGTLFFPKTPMSFADPTTGRVSAYWARHFSRAGRAVPQGQPGSNPGELSRSDCLDIVHVYGQLTVLDGASHTTTRVTPMGGTGPG